MKRRDWLALLAASPLAACLARAQAGASAAADLPVELLFRKPAYRNAVLSPDQRYMAVIAPANGRSNLTLVDLDLRKARRLTNFNSSDINRVYWANNTRLIYTTGDEQGVDFRDDGGLFGIDIDGGHPAEFIKPFATDTSVAFVPRFTTMLRRLRGRDDEVLVMANDRSVDSQDLYRMNVSSGRKTLLSFSTPGKVLRWVLDEQDVPRATLSMEFDKRRWWSSYLPSADAREWKTMAQWDEQLTDVIIPLAFDPMNPAQMFVASNRGRDTMALFAFDVAAGKLGEMIYADERHDVFSFLLLGEALGEGGRLLFGGSEDSPGKLIGLEYQADKPTRIWFDAGAARAQASIDASLRGTVNTFDVSAKRALVFARSDVDAGEYYLYDREKGSLEETGIAVRPQLDPKLMRPMQAVSWRARDGAPIQGYLTLPATWTKGAPVPLVLHPHGGPWARDVWSFNPEVQFLANRGFAVLQPNFRGSTGFGARHLRLSFKQWGGTMIDDMIEGVEWAVKEGYGDAARLGVYGASYGGYATLMALERRPDLFKWGVNYVGVTDMAVHQDTQPAQLFGDFAELSKRLTGDQKADAALFEAQSPARHVAEIKVPVFHAYGGEDRNVNFANGRAIRAAFDKADKPYEWMFVADEAHGYRQDANVFEFYKRFDRFIKQNTPAPKKA